MGTFHPLKQQNSIELRPKGIEDFFKKHSWKDLKPSVAGIYSSQPDSSTYAHHVNIFTKLTYILQTAEALKHVVHIGALNKNDIKMIRAFAKSYSLDDKIPNFDKNMRMAENELAIEAKRPKKDEL